MDQVKLRRQPLGRERPKGREEQVGRSCRDAVSIPPSKHQTERQLNKSVDAQRITCLEDCPDGKVGFENGATRSGPPRCDAIPSLLNFGIGRRYQIELR